MVFGSVECTSRAQLDGADFYYGSPGGFFRFSLPRWQIASRIGRPKTTGTGLPMVVRMHDRQIVAIDVWIKAQGEDVSRPEAIRRLVEIGLKAK